MMKNIIIVTVFFLAIFLLTRYYKQSSLGLQEGAVVLEVKGKKAKLKSSPLKSESKHFANVDIEQKEFIIDGSKTYYEEALINGLYEFNYNIKEIIITLFGAEKIKNIFSIHALHAMQITTKKGEVINLFVTDDDTKELHLFYGLSNKLFSSTILTLTGEDKLNLEKSNELKTLHTRWSVLNNDFKGIISSIDY